ERAPLQRRLCPVHSASVAIGTAVRGRRHKEVRRVIEHLAVMEKLGVCRRRDDVVAGLNLKQEARYLADLLPDHDVARVIWMRRSVQWVKLIASRDLRQVHIRHPADAGIATADKVLGVSPVLRPDAPNTRHAGTSARSDSASGRRISPEMSFGS